MRKKRQEGGKRKGKEEVIEREREGGYTVKKFKRFSRPQPGCH